MERLTIEEAINREKMMAKRNRWNGKFTKVSQKNEEINKRFKADCIKDAEEHEQLAEWLEELKSYKEAEEQGLLVRLPCKVGDMVYKITRFCSGGIRDCGYSYECPECPEYKPFIEYIEFKIPILKDIGKSVFLTREEAEKKLEELGNDKT